MRAGRGNRLFGAAFATPLLFAVAATCASAAEETADQASVRGAVEKMFQAYGEKDLDAFLAEWLPDASST